jgi:hypothetical protein
MFVRYLFVLFVFVSFVSCKRSDDTIATFSVSGIHDIDMNKENGNVLSVAVDHQEGTQQEHVVISVENLPAGVTTDIKRASGIPGFTAEITFHPDLTTPVGTYPITIVATSAGKELKYDLNITVPSMNGWYCNGKFYPVTRVVVKHGVPGTTSVIDCYANETSNSNGDLLRFAFNKSYNLPQISGITNLYKIVDIPPDSDVEMFIYTHHDGYVCWSKDYGQKMRMAYVDGMYKVFGSQVLIPKNGEPTAFYFHVSGK